MKIKGVGPKRLEDLANGIPVFTEELLKLNEKDIKYAIDWNKKKIKNIKPNENVKDQEFILTNFMKPNYDLEDYIWDNFGDIGNEVTSNTKTVIANNYSIITPKMIAAEKLGVPVLTLEEFFVKISNVPNPK